MSLNITKEQFEEVFDNYGKTVFALALATTKSKRRAMGITKRTFSEYIVDFTKEDIKYEKYKIFSIASDKVISFLNGEEIPSDWTEVWDKSVEENQDDKISGDVFAEIFPATENFDVKQRQVLVLAMEKFNNSDISKLIEIPTQTVNWLVSQNKKEIKNSGFAYSKYLKERKTEIPDVSDIFDKLVEKYDTDFFVKIKKKFPWSRI